MEEVIKEQEVITESKRTVEDDHQFQMINYKNLYSLEKWYHYLKDYTFHTVFVTLSKREVEAFVHFYEENVKHKNVITSEDHVILDELTQRLEQTIQTEFLEKGNYGAFAKLSTRSPKDVLMESEKLLTILKKNIKSVPLHDFNGELIAYINSLIEAGNFTSGKEIVEVFSKSERIYVDLTRWLMFPQELGDMFITLREFRSDLRAHMEFRGFVYQNKLNCVSQYYDTVCFDILVKNETIYKQKILSFFETIQKLIPIENYVVDFVCFDDHIRVIELNPWASTSGASLFSWHKDRSILFNGPFEFRILSKPEEDVIKTIFPEIKKIDKNSK